MGVITNISLKEVQELFPSYNLKFLEATTNGIVDTTLIVSNVEKSYILKKYERDISKKIISDTKLLSKLFERTLNVPILLATNRGWYLYKKLDGEMPRWINSYHIVSLARFMAQLHSETKNIQSDRDFIAEYNLKSILAYTKKEHYSYFKKLSFLQNYKAKNDGLIHGDIFQDNCIFEGSTIGVFDFIDSGSGEFLFDIAVALSAFNPSKRALYLNLFINTYNQKAPKKIVKKELLEMLKVASAFYALLRIDKYKNTKKARELL